MSYREILWKAARAAQQFIPLSVDKDRDEDGAELAMLKDQLARLERKYWEQFDVIERVLKERDQWKDLYKTHVLEHLTAQSMMSRTIVTTRTQLVRLLQVLNKLLEEKNLPPIKTPSDALPAEGQPADLPEKFVAKMQALHACMKESLDAIGKRDELAKGMNRPL
jgi:hypothetical protein